MKAEIFIAFFSGAALTCFLLKGKRGVKMGKSKK